MRRLTTRRIVTAIALLAGIFMISAYAVADVVDDPYLRLIQYPGSGTITPGSGPVTPGTFYFQNTSGSTISYLLVTATTTAAEPFALSPSSYLCNPTSLGTGTLLAYGSCTVNYISNTRIEFSFNGITIPDQGKFGLNAGGSALPVGRWTDATRFTFAPVPEPASMLLLGSGLLALWPLRRRN